MLLSFTVLNKANYVIFYILLTLSTDLLHIIFFFSVIHIKSFKPSILSLLFVKVLGFMKKILFVLIHF